MGKEYIEIVCPICGRTMGDKATERIKPYPKARSSIVISKIDYLDFMINNYDMKKKIGIIKQTGKAGFGNFKKVNFEKLPKTKKTKFRKLCIMAIKYIIERKIIKKSDIEKL